jgi:hypothetical protein
MHADIYRWLVEELLILAPTGKQQMLFVKKFFVEFSL